MGDLEVRRTITPDPKYFANLHKITDEDRETRERVNILKDVSGEGDSLAPLDEDGEEGTTASANEDNEDGTDPQAEVGVGTTTNTAG